MSTYADIQGMNDKQLSEELMKLLKEQMNLRFQKATGTLENPNRYRDVRKTVAQIKTEQSARANGAAVAAK